MRRVTADEAVQLVKSGDTVLIGGSGGGHAVPEALLAALGRRFDAEHEPRNITAVHPVVRTNPVTGWKSIFSVGHHVEKINDLKEEESKGLLEWFLKLVVENHDLQVRHRWQNVNDLAIWDNRSVYHAATPDYLDQGLGERSGQRAVSLGEKPYFDPESTSRREALAKETRAE